MTGCDSAMAMPVLRGSGRSGDGLILRGSGRSRPLSPLCLVCNYMPLNFVYPDSADGCHLRGSGRVTRVTPRRKGDGPGMFIAVLGEVRTFKGRDIDIRRTVPADVQRNFQAIPCITIRPTLQNVDELAKVLLSVSGSN